jgi:acyl-CoA dehydrogenase
LPSDHRKLLELAREIARDVVAPRAARVDLEAMFPFESISALRDVGLLAAGAPKQLGGMGLSVSLLATLCSILSEACGSVGLIFAMQQAQLLTLCRHGSAQPSLSDVITAAVSRQWLIASATSEAGTGGGIRSSIAFLDRAGEVFELRKHCPTLSYGAQADAILVTSRRCAESPPGDQVLALIMRDDYELRDVGQWHAMGMRGTMSGSATIIARGSLSQIFDEPFRAIAAKTMVPISHVLWSACWLGLARSAIATAMGRIRSGARTSEGDTGRGSLLARAAADLDALQSFVSGAARALDDGLTPSEPAEYGMAHVTFRANSVKLGASRLAREICLTCLECCGLDGYREDGSFSVARAVRDVLSASLMIDNQRLAATNGELLQIVDGRPATV